jgi:hypothetical protein
MARRRRSRQETEDLLLAEYERRLPAWTALQRTFRTCELPQHGIDFHNPDYLRLRPRHLRAQVLADWLSSREISPKWIPRFGFYPFACGILNARPSEFTRVVLALHYRLSVHTVTRYLKAARARRRAAACRQRPSRALPS